MASQPRPHKHSGKFVLSKHVQLKCKYKNLTFAAPYSPIADDKKYRARGKWLKTLNRFQFGCVVDHSLMSAAL